MTNPTHFDPLDHPICFSAPARMAPSTWTGHIPFAMFLTALLAPRVIVELGTYAGTSYCAFCHAVKELQIETRCFGIGTWDGDPHSGLHGTEVLAELRQFHDSLYGSFSRLVKGTFDEAANQFDAATIDLLHIDGYHTYGAVKHDYETWVPKVSGRGVILFHDVAVRERDCGVWKLWEELKPRYPHFEFAHAYGLGMILVGSKCPDSLHQLCEASSGEQTRVREFFSRMGGGMERLQQALIVSAERQRETQRLRERLNETIAGTPRETESPFKTSAVGAVSTTDGNGVLEDGLGSPDSTEGQGASVVTGPLESHAGELDSTPELIIGIVTYNTPAERLRRLLSSVELAMANLDQPFTRVEVLLVDNGAHTGIPQSTIPITRLASKGNVGFGSAMNDLMAAAFSELQAQWFLCVNPDGILHQRCLAELLRCGRNYPDSLVEARQFPEEHRKAYDPRTCETPWASGACLLINRQIYQTIGGFDPNFFMYMEDVDLSWRARGAGFSVRLAPAALFGHAVLGRRVDGTVDRQYLLSGRYLAFKWGHKKFREWTERELIARGYYASRTLLPPLPETNYRPPDRGAADFTNCFSFVFAKSRWS